MSHERPVVAILDDSPEDREVVRRYLTADPGVEYQVLEFDSSDEAVRACRRARPDCFVLDYDLVSENGIDVVDKLTGGAGVAPFAIVMLTGKGSEAIAVQALKRGVMDYLVKGQFSAPDLRRTIAESIRKFELRPSMERQRSELERAHRTVQESLSERERLILIVDDSEEDRFSVRRALAPKGDVNYRFLEEESGTEGLSVCRSAGIDCLILDYSLPDMDGLEFLMELTGGTSIVPFPVVMLTGRGDEMTAVQALKHGAMDYLVKGKFSAESLRATVDQAIRRVATRRVQEEQRVRLLERLEAEARRRANELAEVDKRKDDFLAMLAHELRNPLAPIANSLHLLRLAGVSVEARERAVDVAERQVRHLARLVDDLMEVSRITRGKVALVKQAVELNPIVSRAVETARTFIDSQGHSLTLELPQDPIVVEADGTRLEQIFSNLLNNAAKYTNRGGEIRVRLAREENEAVISVRDNGIGMDSATLARVFELFAQADRSLDRAQGGLGIGLTLVRALAEQHGGSATAVSDGPGKGSEFSVRLPVLEVVPGIEKSDGPRAVRGVGRPLRVLLVDDHVDGVETMAMLFRVWGHDVRIAHNGFDGIELAETFKPDIAFLDIGLPRISGYEVARTIHDRFGDESPVLAAVTGYGQSDDRRRAVEAGFSHHLVKPVGPEDLLEVLAGVATKKFAAVTPSRGASPA